MDGNPDGKHKFYYREGNIEQEGKYIVGVKDGDWKYYSPDGALFLIITYKMGEEIKLDNIGLPYPVSTTQAK